MSEHVPVTDDFELPAAPDSFGRLWTPHRTAYVSGGQKDHTEETCPFCTAPTRSDEDSLIVYRGEHAFVVLNLYPYNPGHLLVCPYRHIPLYDEATPEETIEIAQLTQRAMRVLRAVARTDGFNIGMNQGKVGGAGIADHLHQHVLPRWSGDTNFLPIIAQTKTMSRTLDDMRREIARGFEEID
ncbi:MAG: HIT domain-containing protein [Rothia sp. (in: high G+C Gram-positive bacteria)]|uniref:HIT family protein n=1 Tax=Rothia sp. (in: high G+C Gram-positive bacteria) TaxID=1885016 RepID=UPI0026DF0650|nr:HIT domain-containing protein [Rothia sp. (in: high G+C Gram-positive bacteria)]MDO5750693.1 HIT domain-containing protein [Rothia sp. (in: high G+C Gram-positive bacteria)]